MKYIDAEKLKVLLSDLKENHKHYKGDFHEGVVFAVNEIEEEIEEIINSFQQEQSSFSSNLEEAAKEYSESLDVELQSDSPDCFEEIIPAFIARAEWQSKKDETVKED